MPLFTKYTSRSQFAHMYSTGSAIPGTTRQGRCVTGALYIRLVLHKIRHNLHCRPVKRKLHLSHPWAIVSVRTSFTCMALHMG